MIQQPHRDRYNVYARPRGDARIRLMHEALPWSEAAKAHADLQARGYADCATISVDQVPFRRMEVVGRFK